MTRIQDRHDESTTPPPATDATVFKPSAEAYESGLVPAIFEPWGKRLIDRVGLRTGERVLDLACGSGIVARLAAAQVGPGGTVVGLDVNPDMLTVAAREAGRLGLSIDWREGNAATPFPFGDDAFDVVLCQQGLQFFTDRELALKEVHRVTVQRGRVAFAVWRGLDQHPVYEGFDGVLAEHLSAEVVEGSDAPFGLADVDELRRLFRTAGFSDVRIEAETGTVRFGTVKAMLDAVAGAHAPVAAAISDLSGDRLQVLMEDLERAMHPFADDNGGVTYPMVASIIVAGQ